MKTAHENELSKALEFIKSKHNGEIPYKYGSMECAKLMTQFASQFREPSTEQSGGTEQEDDQELCWRDIYMSFNDGEGWLKFSSRMSKHFKITRKP